MSRQSSLVRGAGQRRPLIHAHDIDSSLHWVVQGVPGYGIPDSHLRKLVESDKAAKVVTDQYRPVIDRVRERYSFKGRVIVLAQEDAVFWKGRGIEAFYEPLMSNRDNCVLFVNQELDERDIVDFAVPHEFGHHHQFYHGRFPVLLDTSMMQSRPWQLNLVLLDERTMSEWIPEPPPFIQRSSVARDLYDRVLDYYVDSDLIRLGWKEGVIRNWQSNSLEGTWQGYLETFSRFESALAPKALRAFRNYVGLLGALDAVIAAKQFERLRMHAEAIGRFEELAAFDSSLNETRLKKLSADFETAIRLVPDAGGCISSIWRSLASIGSRSD